VNAAHGAQSSVSYIPSRDLLYADDTLGAEVDEHVLQSFLDSVVKHGESYGLRLNWNKTILLPVRHDGVLKGEGGVPIKRVQSAVYLGGLLAGDGDPSSELSRRIGEAGAAFDALARVWKHANVTRQRKLEIYRACILPKLMYGLETLWLRGAEQKRLNAFHVKCLRKVLGIRHAYYSHVSNADVLTEAGDKPLFNILLGRQMKLYSRVVQMEDACLQRQVALAPGEAKPAARGGKARKGRPRQTWTTCIYHHIRAAFGEHTSEEDIRHATADEWERVISSYVTRLGPGDATAHSA
jgi:hypothetical protein